MAIKAKLFYAWVGTAAIFVALTIVILGTTGVMAAQNHFSWEPDYNRAVHGHMVNAYYADTPELMIQELEQAKAGMQELGLEPSLYSDTRPWKQTPDRTMKYQYEHLDSIIARAYDVIEWRDSNGGGGEINDVYGAKMDDLRGFITKGGWSDDIAQQAFYVEHHRFYKVWWDYAAVNLGVWFVALFATQPAWIVLANKRGW